MLWFKGGQVMNTMAWSTTARTWRLYSTLVSTTYPSVLEAPLSAQRPFYQVIHQRVAAALPRAIPRASLTRLVLLITGILAATSTVIAQVAAELDALARTRATRADSIARRLRRTLNDPHLDHATCYAPVRHQVLDWDDVLRGQRRVVLIVDESSKADAVHLFRVSLPYWGGSVPLAWCVWQHNVALPTG
jgi:hypothetical protein